MEVLNRPGPVMTVEIMDDDDSNEEIEEGPITKFEIKNPIKDMKNSKAAGIDNITVEIMKADIDTTVDALHGIFRLIWKTKEFWKIGGEVF